MNLAQKYVECIFDNTQQKLPRVQGNLHYKKNSYFEITIKNDTRYLSACFVSPLITFQPSLMSDSPAVKQRVSIKRGNCSKRKFTHVATYTWYTSTSYIYVKLVTRRARLGAACLPALRGPCGELHLPSR